jgi:hypothetical protein
MKAAYRRSENNQEKHEIGKSLIWLGRVTGLADPHKKMRRLIIFKAV